MTTQPSNIGQFKRNGKGNTSAQVKPNKPRKSGRHK